MRDPYTLGIATFVGIASGLKHNGGFRHGIRRGLIAMGAISALNGVASVIANLDSAKTI
jgi:hypothetical protein